MLKEARGSISAVVAADKPHDEYLRSVSRPTLQAPTVVEAGLRAVSGVDGDSSAGAFSGGVSPDASLCSIAPFL